MDRLYPLAIVVIVITTLCGCVGEPGALHTYSDGGQIINIDVGDEFVISLACLESSRQYRWVPSYDTGVLTMVETNFESSQGIEWFRFRGKKTGEIQISLAYVDVTYEGTSKPLDKKEFTINVD